jgi:hypothetical protein
MENVSPSSAPVVLPVAQNKKNQAWNKAHAHAPTSQAIYQEKWKEGMSIDVLRLHISPTSTKGDYILGDAYQVLAGGDPQPLNFGKLVATHYEFTDQKPGKSKKAMRKNPYQAGYIFRIGKERVASVYYSPMFQKSAPFKVACKWGTLERLGEAGSFAAILIGLFGSFADTSVSFRVGHIELAVDIPVDRKAYGLLNKCRRRYRSYMASEYVGKRRSSVCVIFYNKKLHLQEKHGVYLEQPHMARLELRLKAKKVEFRDLAAWMSKTVNPFLNVALVDMEEAKKEILNQAFWTGAYYSTLEGALKAVKSPKMKKHYRQRLAEVAPPAFWKPDAFWEQAKVLLGQHILLQPKP